MYPSLNTDLKIIFYFKFLPPVSVCLCACFLTWGYMHKLNKIPSHRKLTLREIKVLENNAT